MSQRRNAVEGSGLVLLVLASGQFLMTLDSSVMNVSIASVAKDVGTDVTGIQTAITLYTLVMASLMITGGKIGTLLGRRRAFGIGLMIYAAGSLTTALAPNLPVLLFGWSFLEGVGAALIMPAIVALVAGNFPPERRAATYGTIAAAGAMAVAAGPLIGGAVTTFFSWRYVFVGEVIVVFAILMVLRRVRDAPVGERTPLDLVGVALSIAGLAMTVFGVLRSGEWGWVQPKPDAPELFGISPVLWLVLGGLLIVYLFLRWEAHVVEAGREPLVRPSMLQNKRLTGGLTMFFFQFMVQAGAFFAIPLFLSVVLELSALETGARLVPLSIALLITAAGVPKVFPHASPRRVVRLGLLFALAGTVVLVGGLDLSADASVVAVPLILIGLGIGALSSQLGAITVSAVPDDESAEVGGLQNTLTNLGASLGTALIGSILIAGLTAAFIQGVQDNPDIPQDLKTRASVELAGGIPFISDTDLKAGLADSDVPPQVQQEVLNENAAARLNGLQDALSVVAIIIVLALFFTGRLPSRPVGAKPG
ncbi:MAG: MFS transporter [Actinomycetota bacterium]